MGRYGEFARRFGETGVLAVIGRLEGHSANAKPAGNRRSDLRSRDVLTNILIEPVVASRAVDTTH